MNTYLRFRNWSHYQNADLAKKSAGSLAWIKLWTKYDRELSELPYGPRLLFHELLKLAGRELNAIPNDLNWISANVAMDPEDVTEGIAALLKGGWIHETKSARRSRNDSRNDSRKESRAEREDKKERSTRAREKALQEAAERYVREAAHYEKDEQIRKRLEGEYGITDSLPLRRLLVIAQEEREAA